MPHVVREGMLGDMGGGGKNAGNNWHKFTTNPKNIKEGRGGKKKDATVKSRKPYDSGGMKNNDDKM